MAICNRDLDASQQKVIYSGNIKSDVGQSLSPLIGIVSTPGVLQAVRVAAQGFSGSPVGQVEIQRFVPGAGLTAIVPGSTLALQTLGTSGILGMSLAAIGSTLLNLQVGDVLVWRAMPVANTAALEVQISCVVKNLQDILSTFGSQT